VAKILKNEYGFDVEWLSGSEIESGKVMLDGVHVVVDVSSYECDDGVVVIHGGDEWLFRAILDKVIAEAKSL